MAMEKQLIILAIISVSYTHLDVYKRQLFVERTAFIIAADEQMIRNGVRAHFNGVELSDELVTSYFDKMCIRDSL